MMDFEFICMDIKDWFIRMADISAFLGDERIVYLTSEDEGFG